MPHPERSFRDAPNQDASVRPDTASAGRGDSTQKSAGLSLQSDDFGFGRQAGTVPTGPDPLIGAACGDVVIERQVGEGGMGRVYVGLQQRPSRRVAVKVMRPDVMTAANALRLHREADFLGGLQHPGIAQVFSAGTHTDAQGALQPYVILEYLPNARTIVEWCDRQRLPEQGRLKIVDFGVASRVDVATTATNPADRRKVVGTLAYMSPEQRDGAAVDARSDVYSLGIVAAELLTDSPPAAGHAAAGPVRTIHLEAAGRPPRPARGWRVGVKRERHARPLGGGRR